MAIRNRPDTLHLALGAVALLFAALLGWFIWHFDHYRARATLAAAYGARIACSCRYIEGRSLDSCKADFQRGMEMVMLNEDEEARTISATYPLMSSATVRYKGASGCVLDPRR